MADGVAQPAHETPPPLANRHLEPGLRRQALEHPHRSHGRWTVVEADPVGEAMPRRGRRRSPHLRPVDAGHALPRMGERRGEGSVIREEQEPGRLQVESADGIDARTDAGHERANGGTPLGVVERRHDPARLVQHDGPRRGPPQGLSIHRDHVDVRIGARPQRGDRGPVDAHPPGTDQRLRRAPRGDPRGTE
jgi:hypothetical protein